MEAAKRIILWLTLAFACFFPASALTPSAPENPVWQIFSTGYDASTAEATDLGNRTETSKLDYDSAPIYSALTEKIPTQASRSLFSQSAEFKAAEEEGATLTPYNNDGHHIPAKSAFNGAENYNAATAPAMSNAEMAAQGVDHQIVSNTQNSLYSAFAKTGQPLTWDSMQSIETQALIKGGMNPQAAGATVSNAINQLKASGVAGPTRIPWGGK